MKSQLTFTPEVLTCCTRDNHCDYYYLTLLVIYESLNILKNDLALMVIYSYNLHRAQPEEDSLGFFLGSYRSSYRSREFFLATMLLHLHCFLFGF